jgi:glycosyltransferase involved in cell wall biosynthesis
VLGVSCFDGMAGSMRVRNLLEPLVQKDIIALSNLIYEKDNKEPIGKQGTLRNIHFKIIGFRLSNIFSVFGFFFGGFSFLRRSKKKGQKNIIYNYNAPDIKCIFFILYARLIGYKIIFDIIEDNSVEAHVGFLNKVRIKTSVFLFKNCRYFSDGIISISEHLYQLAKTFAKKCIPVYLIPITVNLNYFKKTNPAIPKNKLQIFYGGSFAPKDGLEYLISAFNTVSTAYPDIELVLTGKGHKQDMDKITAQIAQCANKDKIAYKGFLSTESYYTLLNESDIFCMTRVNSKFANAGFPFKLGEFLAAGKAVIATRVGDVPNYLTNDVNALLINPDSVNELADALKIVLANADKRTSLGIAARKTAEDSFDSDKIGIQLVEIFAAV